MNLPSRPLGCHNARGVFICFRESARAMCGPLPLGRLRAPHAKNQRKCQDRAAIAKALDLASGNKTAASSKLNDSGVLP